MSALPQWVPAITTSGKTVPTTCPWCGRHMKIPADLDLPIIFKCSDCRGTWVLTSAPEKQK